MKRRTLLIIALCLMAALVCSSSVWAADHWGTYQSKDQYGNPAGAWLDIYRDVASTPGWYVWTYEVQNFLVDPLSQFGVGLAYKDDRSVTTGRLQDYEFWRLDSGTWVNYTSSVYVTEGASSARWDLDDLGISTGGGKARFVFQTDLPYVTLRTHDARDGIVVSWADKATPAPYIPEPMSMVLGTMGLGSVAGFLKLRKR